MIASHRLKQQGSCKKKRRERKKEREGWRAEEGEERENEHSAPAVAEKAENTEGEKMAVMINSLHTVSSFAVPSDSRQQKGVTTVCCVFLLPLACGLSGDTLLDPLSLSLLRPPRGSARPRTYKTLLCMQLGHDMLTHCVLPSNFGRKESREKNLEICAGDGTRRPPSRLFFLLSLLRLLTALSIAWRLRHVLRLS